MKAFVLLTARTGDITAVVRQLKRVEGVLDAHITFGPYDAVAVIETDDVKKIGAVVHGEIHPIPGVLDTLTCLAVD